MSKPKMKTQTVLTSLPNSYLRIQTFKKMMGILVIAVTSLLILGIIGLISHFVDSKSDKWPTYLRYVIALPYALIGGTIAIPSCTLILLVQRFVMPLGEFEANVFWYEAIIAPAAYSYFFYKYLTILPKFYLPISITLSLLFFTFSMYAISKGPLNYYIVDIVKDLFYTESLQFANTKLINVTSIISQTATTTYMIYSFYKENKQL